MADGALGTGADLQRLTEVSRALTYARSLEDVLDLTVDCAIDLLGCEKAVLMMNDDEGLLEIRAHRGIADEAVDRFRVPLVESILARLAELLGPDAETHFLGVPLVVRGGVIGLLAVRRPKPGGIGDREEWLLSALADQAAVALESAGHEALQERVHTLQQERSSSRHAMRIMSHDLRSPLNAIQGYLEILGTETLGPLNEDQARTVQRIREVARHLASLHESVLEAARVSGEEIRLEPRRVRLDGLLTAAVDIARPEAEQAGVEITVDAEDELEAELDPDRLRQVIVQLLENATKYCPEGSRVSVMGRPRNVDDEEWVEIVVSDDGPGIPLERQSEIFEPYRSFRDPTGGGHTGFGLGLSIVRSLVERMGGTVGLRSELGEGSTFILRLPACPPG